MNTEAIIEKLLLIGDEQILNTPLKDLDLSPRVYRGLWRSRVRTVRDLAQTWNHILEVRNIGERARCEILEALQAWSLSIPELTEPDDAENQTGVPDGGLRQAVRTPIEALHLSQRTYRALKRNQIDSLKDIYWEWDKIAALRHVGPATLDEIQKALEAPHRSESVGSFANPDGIARRTGLTGKPAQLAVDRKDPDYGSPPAKNDFGDLPTANAVGDENIHETPTKKYVITDSGVVVNADLLQAEEPRRRREERWKNVSAGRVSAKPQDYAPKNIFQAIGQGPDKISGLSQGRKKTPDDPDRKYRNLLRVALETLEKANRPRKVRTVKCPLCAAYMKSIEFEKHLVNMHPQAFQELQSAVSGSLGWHNQEGVGLVFTDPLRANHVVKCPLCLHRDRYRFLQAHIQISHPEVDAGLMIKRFNSVNKSKDYENLLRYQAELNELIKEYEHLKQGQDEPGEGGK